MLSIELLLFILGIVCLFLAAINVSVPRVNLGWLGLFFIFLASRVR